MHRNSLAFQLEKESGRLAERSHSQSRTLRLSMQQRHATTISIAHRCSHTRMAYVPVVGKNSDS